MDSDSDTVLDKTDNCRTAPNFDQIDLDLDEIGDACDLDLDPDNDGLQNAEDNCPVNYNPDQKDSDGDNRADACDNCPKVANPDQADADGNGAGDVCELGTLCSTSSDCHSGHCVSGICCDRACDEICNACTSAETGKSDGTCAGRLKGFKPKTECFKNIAIGSQCDGGGNLQTFDAVDCGEYACAEGACLTQCSTSEQCSTSGFCDGSACKPKQSTGASCSEDEQCTSGFCVGNQCADQVEPACDSDGHLLRFRDGTKDCAPFACRDGACLDSCESIQDCVRPLVCDPSSRCVDGESIDIDPGSLSCDASGSSESGKPYLLTGLGLGLGALLRRASQRRTRVRR
jgi:hypothetical protein